jgi:hypothetical protein
LLARVLAALGLRARVRAGHYEDIGSLSNVEQAIRNRERVELPRVVRDRFTGTW